MRLCSIVLLLLLCLACQAQRYIPTVHLDQSSGLALNTVSCLAEDSLGRIWIGTTAGLYVYDGTSLKPFAAMGQRVLSLHARGRQVICLGIDAIFCIEHATGKAVVRPLPVKEYYQSFFLEDGILLHSQRVGDSIFLDYQLEDIPGFRLKFEALDGDSTSVYDAPFAQGNIRAGLYGAEYIDGDTSFVSKVICSAGLSYSPDRMFVASHEGLIELTAREPGYDQQRHFGELRIECLLKDRNDNLWFGTSSSGLYMLHRNMLNTRYFVVDDAAGAKLPFWGVVRYGNIRYALSSQGLKNMEKPVQPDPVEMATAGITCFSAAAGSDFLLIGTSQNGVYKFQQGKLQQVHYNENESLDNTIVQIVANPSGFLAITKYSLIQLSHEGEKQFVKPYKQMGIYHYIMSLREVNGGYLAATTSGIVKLDSTLANIQSFSLKDSRVFCMSTVFQDSQWFTSMDGGLLELEGDALKHRWTVDKHLYMLANDRDEALWISSGTTVYQYQNGFARPFGRANGFPIREYNQGGLLQDADGQLHFAGVGGVISFYPQNMAAMPGLPEMLLTSDGVPVNQTSFIDLPYDQSKLALNLVTILHADENLFDLSIKLGSGWRSVSKSEQLLIDVPVGESALEWRVVNKITGQEALQTLPIIRALPFWRQSWFMLVSALFVFALMGGLYALFKYLQTRKLLKSEREERRLSQERLRISRELHDNIGARLTHIISSLDVEAHNQKAMSNELDNINAFARQTMAQLRETIWAVDDQTIFLSEWARRAEQYLKQAGALATQELSYHQDLKGDAELSALETINFYRIVQEAVSNAVKYSEAENIILDVRFDGKLLTFQISDDGKGFDSKVVVHGVGLVSMRERAHEAGATFELQSTLGHGCSITITWRPQ